MKSLSKRFKTVLQFQTVSQEDRSTIQYEGGLVKRQESVLDDLSLYLSLNFKA